MKKALFLLSIFFSLSAFSQEVISENSEYITYQDTLLVLKSTLVTNAGLEGINDTTVTYSQPLDSSGLINQLVQKHLNAVNVGAARWRNNFNFRTILLEKSQIESTLSAFNINLDSMVTSQYANSLIGRYRFFDSDGSTFLVDVDRHPTRSDILRGVRQDGNGVIIIRPFSRWLLQVVWGAGDIVYLFWDGTDSNKPVFWHGSANLPTVFTTRNNRRIIKVK